ncbi:MAG: EAL domain-containing protein [Steroidobacteraceae bacterium]
MTSRAKDCDFTPYAQLVAALLPRAGGITLFEPNGELRWTSEDTIGSNALTLVVTSASVSQTSADAGERIQSGGEPLYLFWLRDDSRALIAVFSISWRNGESEQRTFAYVHSMLRPVLECLRRELVLRARVPDEMQVATAEQEQDSRDADLQVLLSTSEVARNDGASDGVSILLRSVNKHMQCEFTALMVPERNLVTLIKAEDSDVDTTLLAKIHRQLLSLAQARLEPSLLNAADSLPGVVLPLRVLSCPIRNPAGRPAGVLALFRSREAPEFRRRDALLADLLSRRAASMIDSSYDTLSGLLTRRAFEQRARVLLDQSIEGRVLHWTGLYLDTDRMHVINDNYGMHVGDKLLSRLGELIRSRLVPGSLGARISGDRFAILLPTGEEDALGFAESLRAGVEGLIGAHLGATDASFSASISIGVAAINHPRVDLPHALAVAETACKAAKDRGRNRVELYQDSDVSIMRRYEDVNIAPTLRAAISENRLRLDAQLIAPMPSSKSHTPHFELLLRMIDDEGATVGPGRFMSAAVRYQLMPAVDRWVIQEAVRLLTPHAALLRDCPAVFTINISGQSLGEEGFADLIIEHIRGSGIPPKVFCFELTESAAIANLAHAEVIMKRLREFGCTIALDDFGTGLSSLAYLRALPVDMLKIDGSFVRDVLKDPRAESMVQAIAQLARSMNLVTVAEYVETDEIRLRIAQLGVDYGQGFAIARPAPFADAIRDLPTYASAARLGPGEEIILEGEADTISAELQQQLLDAGLELTDQEDTLSRMEKILAGYDHTESTLYQGQAGG